VNRASPRALLAGAKLGDGICRVLVVALSWWFSICLRSFDLISIHSMPMLSSGALSICLRSLERISIHESRA
jgi:hypothetical protein